LKRDAVAQITERGRRCNCHDHALAESFFSSLKRERIRRRTCKTREEGRQDVFDYVEMV
jgi:putative transposase